MSSSHFAETSKINRADREYFLHLSLLSVFVVERIETVVGAKACCVLFMRALLLLLLLLCVTERKSLKTDVVSSTKHKKERPSRESFVVSIESKRFFCLTPFFLFFFGFFDFDSFFVFFILNEKGILQSKLLLLLN